MLSGLYQCCNEGKKCMRNKARRWIALLMVLALCLSLLPASALAATAANGSSLTELGTGSYTDVVAAVEELMAGEKAEHFGDIHRTYEDGERMVTTPPTPLI